MKSYLKPFPFRRWKKRDGWNRVSPVLHYPMPGALCNLRTFEGKAIQGVRGYDHWRTPDMESVILDTIIAWRLA